MIKFFVFLLLILLFQVPTKAQVQRLLPQDVQVIKYEEISGHIFAIATINENDSCRYFLLNSVANDFYIISGLCKGDEAASKFLTDEELEIMLKTDTEQRNKQNNPEKSNQKSEQNSF